MCRMNRMRWFILFIAMSFLVTGEVMAKRPKVTKKEGHISPVMVKVNFPGGESRTGPLIALGRNGVKGNTHRFEGLGPGNEKVIIWLDTIKEIKDTTADDALIILKDGTKSRLEYAYLSQQFFIATEAGGESRINFSQVDSVEFLSPPRIDKDGHTMFDDWSYSPYTGEKLAD